jgi:hypothetical protein
MTEERKKEPKSLGPRGALGRFIHTDARELADRLAANVLKGRKRAEKRIKEARQEIEDGARPRKGRFGL